MTSTPYDSRNFNSGWTDSSGRADAAFVAEPHSRTPGPSGHARFRRRPTTGAQQLSRGRTGTGSRPAQAGGSDRAERRSFIQYSLQSKAVERLQKITELFPGEEERNERLRSTSCKLANWWPTGGQPRSLLQIKTNDPAPNLSGAQSNSDSVDTMRDLARISEISQSLYRLTSPRAILSASIQEMGQYLKTTRCIAVIGPAGKPPQMASEFCAPGIQPASGGLLVRLLAQLEHAAPDRLGGLPIDAAAAPLLRELGLETALGVILTDPQVRAQAGMVIAGHATAHAWRPHETYFLQAVGDQMLLGVNHIRLRNLARTANTADEKTGPARAQFLSGLPDKRNATRKIPGDRPIAASLATRSWAGALAPTRRSANGAAHGTSSASAGSNRAPSRYHGEIHGVDDRIYSAGHGAGRCACVGGQTSQCRLPDKTNVGHRAANLERQRYRGCGALRF